MAPKSKPGEPTPAMKQFHRFKKQHPDCVLFFRMGDFYEMFYEDARLAHRVLGVTLTQRTEGVPMAGVPYHAVEGYLRRMIQAGHRVAVCDQVEDPKLAKGVVDRDVTRVVTPGTLTDDSLLEAGRDNPLAAVLFHDDDDVSLAWAELSTGAFWIGRFNARDAADELARVGPSELLYVETVNDNPPPRVKQLIDAIGCVGTPRPGWQYRHEEAFAALQAQYGVKSLRGFGLDDDDPSIGPAGAILHYLQQTQRLSRDGQPPSAPSPKTTDMTRDKATATAAARLAHLSPPRKFERSHYLVVDQTSLRSLEIERTTRSGAVEGSLLGVFLHSKDAPVTAMGKRLLRHWLCYPLADRRAIETRQRIVRACVDDQRFARDWRALLDHVHDVPRILGRLAVNRAAPRDVVALGASARQIEQAAALIAQRPSLEDYAQTFDPLVEPIMTLGQQIETQCIDEAPAHLRDGGLFRDGVDAQLDESRSLQRDSQTWLTQYQKTLVEQTAIPSLKVGYNKVFGYYIELTAVHRDKAPDAWTRKQTLKNAERFITPELKDYETRVLSAQQRGIEREQTLFDSLCTTIHQHIEQLKAYADALAAIDVLVSFASRALRRGYVQPHIVDKPLLHVRAARHPVLDEILRDQFVPNDIALGPTPTAEEQPAATNAAEADQPSTDKQTDHPIQEQGDVPPGATLALITGPNMAGKSTYIRQAALITLLAHTGAFVPADSAVVGLCDRIFTRIGASDELHTGQSTFMVEMTETANLCLHATDKSLVILDEIGRGTSTLDGLSLAWAITEHLAQTNARTLFATHYHELTSLPEQFPNIANLNVIVREWQDEIVFLHRIAPGAADRSYGIHVAKLAGLARPIVDRAADLLTQLQVSHTHSDVKPPRPAAPAPNQQLPLFTEFLPHPVVEKLRTTSIEALTPLQAFDLLRQLQKETEDKGNSGSA